MMAQLLQQMQVANQNTVQMMQQNQQAAEARDAAMRQALDQQRTETLQMIKVLSDSMEKVGSKDKSGVVDVKGVGKPEVLHGETKEQVKNKWPLWSFGFTTWFVSQYEQADEMLKWAASHNGAIKDRDIETEASTRTGWDDALRVNRQLHTALVSLTKGETLSILRNSVAQSGLDGWRRLSREYEPQTAQSNYHLLAKVLRPVRVKELSGLRGAIETWERLYTQYQERTSDTLSDAIRRLGLQSLCPEALSEHLDLHASRLGNYDAMRAEIDTYLDIKTSAPMSSDDPMDVDALGKGKAKGKGKGKSKGKGGDKNLTCYACGRFGHIAKDCWHKGTGKNGKGKKPDSKGKAQSKGAKGKDSKGAHKGVKSLEETGAAEQEAGPEAEIHAIFALDASTPTGKGKGCPSGKGKGTGSTEVFIRSVLANLKSVEAREINRAKEELRKGVQDYDLRKKVEDEIAQRKEQLNILKGRSAHFEEDPRYRQDVKSGQNVRLAKRKWKSRVRAAKHRAETSVERAQERVQLEQEWYETFRNPTSSSGCEERKKHQFDRHGGRFDGDRSDLQPDLIMRPLNYKERNSFCQEDGACPESVQSRNWTKPQWMRRNTPEAKKKHLVRTGWRVSMLKQRSRAKKAQVRCQSAQRKGSLRSPPKASWQCQVEPRPHGPDLELIADMAWSRKKIKDLSRQLEEVEDDHEAVAIEEEILVQKAKLASLNSEIGTEVKVSTASGSREVPKEDAESEYEEVKVEPSESEDETWGPWKPSDCLVNLGFSKGEAEELVRTYSKGRTVESLEVFSVDEPLDQSEWKKVFVTVDSGSAVTCFPESLVQGYEINDHQGPQQYTSASNHEVKAVGRTMPVVGFEDWQVHKVNAVILSPLNKPLFSTSRMVQAGWRIVHDSEENGGSFALHRASGRKLKMTVMGGVYKMPIWVKQCFSWRGELP